MKNKYKAFTLIEMLVVVAIIGILAAVGIPQYNGYIENGKISKAENNLQSIYLYQSDNYIDTRSYSNTVPILAELNANDDDFDYNITSSSNSAFEARATMISNNNKFITINQSQTITKTGF